MNEEAEFDLSKLEYAGEPVTFDRILSEAQIDFFMKQLPSEVCAKCRFFNEHENPSFDEGFTKILKRPHVSHEGECRRHAPVQNMGQIDDLNATWPLWPELKSCEWCGDFQRFQGEEQP